MRSLRARLLLGPALALVVGACGYAAVGGDAQPAAQTSYRAFGPRSWPGGDWRPYASSSPFNTPIGSSDSVHPASGDWVARLLSFGLPADLVAGVAGTPDDWGHPTYYAQPDDPVYRLQPLKPWGRSSIRGRRIPIPAAARPAPGGDGHMTVVTPDGWEYDFWQVRSKPRRGGTLTFSWGGRIRIDGDGLGDGGTAAGFGNLAGVIRAQELAAGRIDHALFVVVRCTRGHVWPANDDGAECPRSVDDAPPMGAHLQLAMSDAEIGALDVPDWKKTILRALAQYGAYIGDTGGPGFAFQFESSTMYRAFGQPDPLVAFAQRNGVRSYGGRYAFDLAEGVDWAGALRVVRR